MEAEAEARLDAQSEAGPRQVVEDVVYAEGRGAGVLNIIRKETKEEVEHKCNRGLEKKTQQEKKRTPR